MDTVNCPFGTFGNLVSKSCNNTCNTGYENFLEHKCSTYCTTGTSVYTDGGKQQCFLECPSGYYTKQVIIQHKDETTEACKACIYPCVECTGSDATQCLSCASGYLFHEGNGTCLKFENSTVAKTMCTFGFVYYDNNITLHYFIQQLLSLIHI
eukprot:TRINITY_DN6421_c0_g1_i1.p4 TRINITY_DN6421_c0_g1~~TRINITY_DN6421_c0_g1_i1.p4  ORF type:complete len:153 (-),score=17.45 TRINITY_DN6421_c0_g1_i1:86-544(-)